MTEFDIRHFADEEAVTDVGEGFLARTLPKEEWTFLLEADRGAPIDELVNDLLHSPMGKRDWPLRFWSRTRLMSVEARQHWIEPDLEAMPQTFAVRI